MRRSLVILLVCVGLVGCTAADSAQSAVVYGNPDGWLVQLAPSGEVASELARGAPDSAESFTAGAERDDGRVVLAGGYDIARGSWVVTYDADLSRGIEKVWDLSNGPRIEDVVRAPDGRIVAVGSAPMGSGARAPWVGVVADDGSVETRWVGEGEGALRAATVAADGALVGVGHEGPAGDRRAWIVWLGSSLQPARQVRPLDGAAGTLFSVADGGGVLLVAGRDDGSLDRWGRLLLTVDGAGRVTERLDGPGVVRVAPSHDGGFVAAGLGGGPWVGRLDATGAVLERVELGAGVEPRDVRELADGTLLAAGRRCDGICLDGWEARVRAGRVISEHVWGHGEASRSLVRIVPRAADAPLLLGQIHPRTSLAFGEPSPPTNGG